MSGIYDYIGGSFAELPRGSLVEVPFGGRHLPGIVMGAALGNVTPAKLRPIFKAADLPVLGEPLLAFIERVAGWTMAPIGAVVKMVVSQPAAFTPLPKKILLTWPAKRQRGTHNTGSPTGFDISC